MDPLGKLWYMERTWYHNPFKNTDGLRRDLPEAPDDPLPPPSSAVPPLLFRGLGCLHPPPRSDAECSPTLHWKRQQQEGSQLSNLSPAAWKTRKKNRAKIIAVLVEQGNVDIKLQQNMD